jgi:regulator of sigma E protease
MQTGKRSAVYVVRSLDAGSTEREVKVQLTAGKSGVVVSTYPVELSAPRRGLFSAIALALRESWVMMDQTVKGIGQLVSSLVTRATVPEGITGIVGIAQLTHASVQEGFMTYLRLVALLSLSLAALNILPFPALDGGRLLFVLIEVIGRRPINRRFEVTTNAIGFGLLLLLIGLITYHDIARLF